MHRETLLNFLPIRAGGGLQNALSFLRLLNDANSDGRRFVALVRRDSPIERECAKQGIRFIRVGDTTGARLRFECNAARHFEKGTVCFTLFGPPMLGSRGHLFNIVGCAYSNLFYPEIDFWERKPLASRCLARVIDIARRRAVSSADFWVFETDILKARAIRLAGFPEHRVAVVRMSPSELVSRVGGGADESLYDLRPGFRLLFLSSANPHKRLDLLPAVIRELVAMGGGDIQIVTTFSAHSTYGQRVLAGVLRSGATANYRNVGPVAPTAVARLIRQCDAMGLLSTLESFSNNTVEAWQMQKPFLVTDAEWSREMCGSGAFYLDCSSTRSIAKGIHRVMRDAHLRETLVENGTRSLSTYPNGAERMRAFLSIIDGAPRLGECSDSERAAIKWPRIRGAPR